MSKEKISKSYRAERLTKMKVLREIEHAINDRCKRYKCDTFHQVGEIMNILYRNRKFSNGVGFQKELHMTGWAVGKLVRLVNSGFTDYDSAKDAAAYCALIAEMVGESESKIDEQSSVNRNIFKLPPIDLSSFPEE